MLLYLIAFKRVMRLGHMRWAPFITFWFLWWDIFSSNGILPRRSISHRHTSCWHVIAIFSIGNWLWQHRVGHIELLIDIATSAAPPPRHASAARSLSPSQIQARTHHYYILFCQVSFRWFSLFPHYHHTYHAALTEILFSLSKAKNGSRSQVSKWSTPPGRPRVRLYIRNEILSYLVFLLYLSWLRIFIDDSSQWGILLLITLILRSI